MRKPVRTKGKGLHINYGRVYRLAKRKRQLQKVCIDAGVSQSLAMLIASTFFRKGVFTFSGNAPK